MVGWNLALVWVGVVTYFVARALGAPGGDISASSWATWVTWALLLGVSFYGIRSATKTSPEPEPEPGLRPLTGIEYEGTVLIDFGRGRELILRGEGEDVYIKVTGARVSGGVHLFDERGSYIGGFEPNENRGPTF